MALTGQSNEIEVQIEGDSSGLVSAANRGEQRLLALKNAATVASGALGALATGGIAKAISAAGDFDSAMNESLAIMGDVSDSMEGDMAKAAREVATETEFAAQEAADSYFYLASAGLDAADSIEALPTVAQFAQAGMFDMAQATDILTDAQSALGLKTEELADLSDKLVKANTLANASVRQFGESLINKAAPAMDRMNIGTEEGIAALATFADQGLKGRRAGTILARTLEGLESNARKNADAFDKFGIRVTDADGEMRDLDAIVGDMEDSFADMSTEQRQAALQQLGFNRRAQRGIDLLLGNSDAIATYEDKLNDAGGTAEDVAQNQLDDLNSQWKLLKDLVHDIAITIGQVFVPILTDLIKQIRPVVESFKDWNDETNGVVGAISLVVSAVAGLGGVLLRFAGGPLTLALSMLATLAGAFAKNFGNIRTHAIRALQEVSSFVSDTMDRLKSIIIGPALDAIESLWETHGDEIKSAVADAWTEIQDAVDSALNFLKSDVVQPFVNSVEQLWADHGDEVKSSLKTGYENAKTAVDSTLSVLKNDVINPFLSTVEQFWDDHGDEIKSNLKTGYENAKTAVDTTLNTLKSDVVVSRINEIESEWKEHGQKVETSLKTGYEDAKTAVDSTLTTLEEDIVKPFINSVEQLWNDHGKELKQINKEAYKEARSTADTQLQLTKNEVIIPLTDEILQLWKDHGTDIEQTVTSVWSNVQDAVDVATTQIKDQILGPFTQAVEDLWKLHGEALFNEMSDTWDVITDKINTATTFILNTVISPWLSQVLDNVRTTLDVLQQAWDKWGDEILTIVEFITDIIIKTFKTFGDALLTTFRVFMAVLRGDWEQAWTLVVDFLKRTLDRIVSFAKSWGGRFLSWLGGLVGDIIQWFKDLATELIGSSIIPDMLDDILQAFKDWNLLSTVENIVGDVKGAFDSWTSWVEDTLAGDVKEAFGEVASKIGSALSNISVDWPDLPDWLDDAMDKVHGGINDAIEWVERQRPGNDGSSSSSSGSSGPPSRDDRRRARHRTRRSGSSGSSGSSGRSGGGGGGHGGGPRMTMQEGGIVTAAEMPALLHGPEAVLPLDRLPELMADAMAAIEPAGGNQTQPVVRVDGTDADEIAEALDDTDRTDDVLRELRRVRQALDELDVDIDAKHVAETSQQASDTFATRRE